ncbi:DSBA oxidoreductase family protein [Zostera marina]|uniref:DSBA oxidoreductase family protein n=1 Tax=Zostera marina TaxID=29655 RepID=A0A0K9P774_ZOSMR|nr:DSBA oxidoreductase family protein [Zostera marina]
MATSHGKKFIQIDVSIDTVCPWCFVGRHNLQKAMDTSKEKYDFEVRYHPFFLNTSAPKEGVKKSVYWKQKFGAKNSEHMESRMGQIFRSLGYEYDLNGLTGNSLDSHRLIQFAGKQGYDKQNLVVKELLINYFIEGKYIGDKQVLLDAAAKVGIEGASELLDDPMKGVKEVDDDLRKYSANISGVPYFVINGERHLSGGQPPEAFQVAFESVASGAI